ncbi:unknown [Feldmannia species virus]|uniref:Uncharacterized protein n=1 Tax=Feldmannia species virus TaxID=39420 RepID=B5LWG5_9PHYC|nr:hypothetical protein FeldSpV_gp076 [Feldmannia species virus]ACH46828.1 unknown [Feldmannia species virus]
MDSLFVDTKTGLVGASSLMKLILPCVHDNTLRRLIRQVLNKDSAIGDKTSGKSTRVLTIDESIYLIDNVQFRGSEAWREANGDTFKADMIKHVKARMTPAVADIGGSGHVSNTETRAASLQKWLRSVNIHDPIRVDEETGLGSLLDVIDTICPGKNAQYGPHTLARILEESTSLSERVRKIKINGGGNITPVADAETIEKIIWLLPGQKAREFCKHLGGSSPNGLAGKKRLGGKLMENASREDYESYIKKKVAFELCRLDHKNAVLAEVMKGVGKP